MKILVLVSHYSQVLLTRRELVERLVCDGHDVSISCPNNKEFSSSCAIGCQFFDVSLERHSKGIISGLKLYVYYRRLINTIKPNVVLTYSIKPNIFGGTACRILRVPYIVNITGLGSALLKEDYLNHIITVLYRVALKKAVCIFFQNTENQEYFKSKRITQVKNRLIPGSGVNLEEKKYSDIPDCTVINFIFIGRIMKEKGILEYLECAKEIRGRYPNTRFFIAGFVDEMKSQIRVENYHREGYVEYIGFKNNITEWIQKCHCIVLPSYSEGMSNALLEAAACGRPIITTDQAGCRETVEDGKTGYLVKARDFEDLISKVEQFILLSNEKRREMGVAGRRKMEREFDRQIVVDAYLREIAEIEDAVKNEAK